MYKLPAIYFGVVMALHFNIYNLTKLRANFYMSLYMCMYIYIYTYIYIFIYIYYYYVKMAANKTRNMQTFFSIQGQEQVLGNIFISGYYLHGKCEMLIILIYCTALSDLDID